MTLMVISFPWYESSITGNFCFKTTNDSCAEAVITIIDNPYFEGLYDLEAIDLDNGDQLCWPS